MSDFFMRDRHFSEDEILALTQQEFIIDSLNTMPKKLFKYFPNNENSLKALRNNTVHLSSPTEFDDPYDCNICASEFDFATGLIRFYAELCGIKTEDGMTYSEVGDKLYNLIYEQLVSEKPLEDIYKKNTDNIVVQLQMELLFNTLKLEIYFSNGNENSFNIAFNKVIHDEYTSFQKNANMFKIACFTENPFSILMWSHYAKSHTGFCIEYDIPTYSEEWKDLFHNLFPVVYTDERVDLAQLCLKWSKDGTLTQKALWDFYKFGLLSKSMDWKYQNEWRLISCDNMLSGDTDYNCNFFKINKVYLGNKMPSDERMKIIKICKDRNIPYCGVIIARDKYEMHPCNILCENCTNCNKSL